MKKGIKTITGYVLIFLGLFVALLRPISSITGFSFASESIAVVKNIWFFIGGFGMMIAGAGILMADKKDLVNIVSDNSKYGSIKLDFTPQQYFRFLVEDWAWEHPDPDKVSNSAFDRFNKDNKKLLAAYDKNNLENSLNRVYSGLKAIKRKYPAFIDELTQYIHETEEKKPLNESLPRAGITAYVPLLERMQEVISDPQYNKHISPALYGDDPTKVKPKYVKSTGPSNYIKAAEDSIREGIIKTKSSDMFKVFLKDENNPSKIKETLFTYVPTKEDAQQLCHDLLSNMAKKGDKIVFPLYELAAYPDSKNPKSILYNKFSGILAKPESAEDKDLMKAIKTAKMQGKEVSIRDIGLAIGEKHTDTGGLVREAYYHRDRPHHDFGINFNHYNFHTKDTNIHVLYGDEISPASN